MTGCRAFQSSAALQPQRAAEYRRRVQDGLEESGRCRVFLGHRGEIQLPDQYRSRRPGKTISSQPTAQLRRNRPHRVRPLRGRLSWTSAMSPTSVAPYDADRRPRRSERALRPNQTIIGFPLVMSLLHRYLHCRFAQERFDFVVQMFATWSASGFPYAARRLAILVVARSQK